jgi:hypothetical protein
MAPMNTPTNQTPTTPVEYAAAPQADELSDEDLEFVVGGDPLQQSAAS